MRNVSEISYCCLVFVVSVSVNRNFSVNTSPFFAKMNHGYNRFRRPGRALIFQCQNLDQFRKWGISQCYLYNESVFGFYVNVHKKKYIYMYAHIYIIT